MDYKKAAKTVLEKLPRTYYDEVPKTLQEAAERYAKNEKPRATPQFKVKAKDLWPFREFDRPLKPELAESIKKEGIKEPLHVEIGSDGKYYVAEGNHRLKAMMHTGMSEMEVPVNVEFGYNDILKKKLPGVKSKFNQSKKSILDKGLNALSVPQKILMRKTAETMGANLDKESDNASEDADKASEAIVEKTAEKLGIPESSQLGALAKGAAKTALDIGYDPLSVLPVAKIAKGVKRAGMVEKILAKLGRAPAKIPSMAEREAAVLKQKITDIAAQAKTDRLKRQRANARWDKMSEAEREDVLRKHILPPDSEIHFERMQKQARKETRMTPKQLRERDEAMKTLRENPELSPAEQLAQRGVDLEKERIERLAAPAEELEKTQVIEDPLKKLVKKVAKK